MTSGGQAELGRALGGYINVLTKSGTNAAHGDIYDYVRDDRFNAPNALTIDAAHPDGTKLPMSQQQYGISLGGPIVRDRTFYFANFEQRKLDQSGLVTISPGVVSAVNARLAAVGYPGTPIATGVYANPVHTTNVLGKVDHQFNGRDQFTVRYSLYDVNSSNSRGAARDRAQRVRGSGRTRSDHCVSNTVTLSPRTVNETRAQLATAICKRSRPIRRPSVALRSCLVRDALGSPPDACTGVSVVDNLSHQTVRTRCASRRFPTTTPPSPILAPSAAG